MRETEGGEGERVFAYLFLVPELHFVYGQALWYSSISDISMGAFDSGLNGTFFVKSTAFAKRYPKHLTA
jgi:hypothetical protein